MRRIAFALALFLAAGWAVPSQSQGWGGGWGRPCFGGCGPWAGGGGWARPGESVVLGFAPRPRPFWAGPGGFGPPRFRPAGWGWGWRRWAWRREMRWRRFEAWRRWAAVGRQAAEPAGAGPRVRREAERARFAPPPPIRAETVRPAVAAVPRPAPDEQRAAARPDAAVALAPVRSLHFARPRAPAAVPSRVLAVAATMRRPSAAPRPVAPAVVRVAEPPASPEGPSRAMIFDHPHVTAGRARAIHPVALRNQPPAASPAPEPAAPPAAATPTRPAISTDVPVAPLD